MPEGVGTTKIRATCRSARGTFDASWRRVEKATMALGRVQNFASHLAWQWHTAMEGAHEVSLLGSSLWGRLPVRNGTSATGSQASATAAIDLEASSRALLRRHEPDEGPPRQSQRLRHVLSERGRRESPVGQCRCNGKAAPSAGCTFTTTNKTRQHLAWNSDLSKRTWWFVTNKQHQYLHLIRTARPFLDWQTGLYSKDATHGPSILVHALEPRKPGHVHAGNITSRRAIETCSFGCTPGARRWMACN